MKNIFIIIFLIISICSFSQEAANYLFIGQVTEDINTVNQKLELNAPFELITNSSNKIEIRLISYTTPEYITFYLLSYNRTWSIKYMVYEPKSEKFVTKATNVSNLEGLFNRLVINNIFSLPDEKNIKAEKQLFNKETSEIIFQNFAISHGITYIVEFKVGEKYRRYTYVNPIENAKFFPHVNEYKNMSAIVKNFSQISTNKK